MFKFRLRDSDPIQFREKDASQVQKTIQRHLTIASDPFTPENFPDAFPTMAHLMKSIKVKDIMTQPVHILRADMTLIEIGELFSRYHISGAPVVDHLGRIMGVVSEKNILTKLGIGRTPSSMEIILSYLKNKNPLMISGQQLCACDVMTSPPITVKDDAALYPVSVLMTERRINRVPVIQNDGRPVGIVARTDLIKSCYAGLNH